MDRDYVLGTADDEIARLGLQHAVWRPRALDAWRRAGITRGQRVVDFGAGPGYASLDLAEIVGPGGEVLALDRSPRFLDHLRQAASVRGHAQIRTREVDLDREALTPDGADAAWCRWIFTFLRRPDEALERLVRAVRPGGALVIHEYVDYATWRLVPRLASFDAFVAAVMASWRAEGGEPNIGVELAPRLERAGCRIESLRAIADVVGAQDFIWQWPAGFFDSGVARLVELGCVERPQAEAMRAEFAAAVDDPQTRMVTPMVCEIIARRT
jgi:SAM-dependent methyltransferase